MPSVRLTDPIAIGSLRLKNRLYRAPVLEGAGSVGEPFVSGSAPIGSGSSADVAHAPMKIIAKTAAGPVRRGLGMTGHSWPKSHLRAA